MKSGLLFLALLVFIGNTACLFGYDEKHYARFFVYKKCNQCDLYKANFAGADLTNADFTGSNLILANFQNATLFGADFTDASLSGANFSGAIWVDGSLCGQGSLGKCIKRVKR